jgi:hypothetical protein
MTRLIDAWRALAREQRRVALAALGLFVTMFLPWYSKTDTVVVKGAVKSTQRSLNAFQAFSFVEAAVLLVSAGVLAILFARAERRRFNLPGGDGIIVTIAGGWAALLIFYRLLDKPGLQGNERVTATVGVEWGIFVALLVALGLAYGGWRIHHGERPEMPARRRPRPTGGPAGETSSGEQTERRPAPAPEVPPETGETALVPAAASQRARERPVPARPAAAPARAPRERPRFPPRPGEPEQLSFEDPPASEER